jgi:hypothetical protein
MLISLHGRTTASVGPEAGAVWMLAAFLIWGAALGGAQERLIRLEQTAGAAAVERIDRRRFLVKLGGATALNSVAGVELGELAETRRRQAVMMAGGGPTRWSATHPPPNANAAVQPAPGTRLELTSLERHYRIDINTAPPKIR